MKPRCAIPGRDAPPHTSRHCAQGFTLLEIMVAMVVLSLIMTTAFGALRMGERSWEAGLARSTETETLRTVAGVLQRQFNQILPLTWIEDTQTFITFSGDHQQLRFIAPAPQHHGATGLFEFTLVVKMDTGNAQLVLYYRLYDPGNEGFAPDHSDRQRMVLVDNLNTASFAYYGSPVAGDPPRWHSQWSTEAEAFPRLVRARLGTGTDKGTGPRPWPDLLLALQTGLAQ